MLPASERLPDVRALIRKEQYFVVHAPRQCGKTTAFRALMDEAKEQIIRERGTQDFILSKPQENLREVAGEGARADILKYMDGLGVDESWLVVADADVTKPWDGKISTSGITFGTKTIHLVRG